MHKTFINLSKSFFIIFLSCFLFVFEINAQGLLSTKSADLKVDSATEEAKVTPVKTPINKKTDNIVTSLTVMPPKIGDDFSLLLKPGQKKEVIVEVRNPSNDYLKIESLVKDFIISADGKTPVPVNENINNKFSLAKWITLEPANQVLAPQTLTQVKVLINVPADAVPGGRYAMVLHRPALAGESIDNGVTIMPQIGTLLYVVVDGEITGSPVIDSFSFDSVEFGPVSYKLSLRNNSPTHIRPKVSYEITNIFGKRVGFFREEEKNIFPGLINNYEGKFAKVWGFGLYKANALVEYQFNQETKQLTSEASFWILPIRLMAVSLIILAIVLYLVRSIYKKYRGSYLANKETIAKLNEQIEQLKKDGQNKNN